MLFADIMMNHEEREIVGLCKKLGKSCSFTKNADMSSLCELAYWLYIYDCKEEALKVCEHVNIEIPEKINYNVWDFIIWIWGLEAYIYNETGRKDDKNFRVAQMKKVWSTPKRNDETEEEAWKFCQKIMNRKTFESICNTANIEQASAVNDKKAENHYRLTALYSMIGYGVTDFYLNLENNKEKLSEKINEYMMLLR